MRVISWFSGIGGFDLAFLLAGHEIVGACEIEPFCRRVYTKRFGKPKWFPSDIRKVKADEIPEADLWCAGSPCQDFSIAGKRAGLDGKRSGLLRTWIKLASRVRPRWLCLENVPGFLTVRGGRDCGEFAARLDELGYVGAGATLDARYFGVPQRRRRVFFVGRLGDGPSPGSILAECEGGLGDPAARVEKRAGAPSGARIGAREAGELAASLRAADGHHGRSSPRGDGADTLIVGDETARSLTAPPTGYRYDDQENLVCGPLLAATGGSGWRSGYEVWEEAGVAPTLTETEARLGVLAFNIVPESGQGSDLQASETDVAMALSTEEAKKYERGTRIVAGGVRRLTPLECERLQGLPDGHTCLCGAEPYSTASCKCPDGPRYRALGNSLAVPVAEWIARRLP